MADLAKIVDDLSALTVLEAAELSKMLEEKWGVSAAAPVAVAAAAAPAAVRGRRPRTLEEASWSGHSRDRGEPSGRIVGVVRGADRWGPGRAPEGGDPARVSVGDLPPRRSSRYRSPRGRRAATRVAA